MHPLFKLLPAKAEYLDGTQGGIHFSKVNCVNINKDGPKKIKKKDHTAFRVKSVRKPLLLVFVLSLAVTQFRLFQMTNNSIFVKGNNVFRGKNT